MDPSMSCDQLYEGTSSTREMSPIEMWRVARFFSPLQTMGVFTVLPQFDRILVPLRLRWLGYRTRELQVALPARRATLLAEMLWVQDIEPTPKADLTVTSVSCNDRFMPTHHVSSRKAELR